MREETGMRESSGLHASTETVATGDRHAAEGRRGPGWRGWILSILVAIALSVTATLLLGGSVSFQTVKASASGASGSGCGSGGNCCPLPDAEK